LTASENVDPETLNFDYSDGNEHLYFCLWANLSHNPRIKDFTFVKKSLSFNLPRPELKVIMTNERKQKRSEDEDIDLLPPELRALMEKNASTIVDSEKEHQEEIEITTNEEKDKKTEENHVINEEEDEAKKLKAKEELIILKELSDSFVINLRAFSPLGPILYFGLYQIPPQPKKIKQWVISQSKKEDSF
jgi:cancer susceptibility candidate protein 1